MKQLMRVHLGNIHPWPRLTKHEILQRVTEKEWKLRTTSPCGVP